jgi:transcriptional regulator GlxA family with amidase domain
LAQTYACASLQLIERAWQTRASAHSDPVNLVMQYLIANYSGEITLQELAAIANVTPTHLTHCFTARLGLSPIRYLRHLRIETAKRLLCTTEFLIYDIAQRVGYADHLYFRRVFKEITGQTPSSLRIKSR